jgi:GNAT superfamily N-acetyltransferase
MKAIIRKAKPQDYEALCELIDQVDALHRDHLPGIYRKPEGPVRDKEEVATLLTDDNVGLFVAEMEGELAGYIHAFVRDTPPIPVFVPRRFIMIDSMAVKKNERRKGIGQALIAKVHQWAIEKEATSVELNVYEFNQEAIMFYEALGYEVVRHLMSKTFGNKAA